MDVCWCGGHYVETATPGIWRCTGCGEHINDWEQEDEDEEEEE